MPLSGPLSQCRVKLVRGRLDEKKNQVSKRQQKIVTTCDFLVSTESRIVVLLCSGVFWLCFHGKTGVNLRSMQELVSDLIDFRPEVT